MRVVDDSGGTHVTVVERAVRWVQMPGEAPNAVPTQEAAEWVASCSCGWKSWYRSVPRKEPLDEIAYDWALSAAKVHRLSRAATAT